MKSSGFIFFYRNISFIVIIDFIILFQSQQFDPQDIFCDSVMIAAQIGCQGLEKGDKTVQSMNTGIDTGNGIQAFLIRVQRLIIQTDITDHRLDTVSLIFYFKKRGIIIKQVKLLSVLTVRILVHS